MPGILVVEDDENLNRGIAFSLKKSGYEVFSAESMKKAKRIASDNNVDVTICDVNLSRTALSRLRADTRHTRRSALCSPGFPRRPLRKSRRAAARSFGSPLWLRRSSPLVVS